MKIKVICIVGTKFSGVDNLYNDLSQDIKFTSLGRLGEINDFINEKKKSQCLCGETFTNCSFWRAVEDTYRKVKMGDGFPNFEALNFETPDVNKVLLESISDSVHKEEFIEFTHDPERIELLAKTKGVSLRVIHLVRDGRYVAYRNHKQNKRISLTESMKEWAEDNLKIESIIKKYMPSYFMVRFEDYIRNPSALINKIALTMNVNPYRSIDYSQFKEDHSIVDVNFIKRIELQKKINPLFLQKISLLRWVGMSLRHKEILERYRYSSKKSLAKSNNTT